MQGTTPTRYKSDVAEWLQFIEVTTSIGAWEATEAHAETWASAPLLSRTTAAGRPARPRQSPHNRARRLSALAAFYAYAVSAGHITEPPFNAVVLRDVASDLPRTPRLTAAQAAALLYAADDVLPHRQRQGPYNGEPWRDRLMMYLLLDGLRPRQIVGINLEDLHEEDPHRRVRTLTCLATKGGGTITHQPAREVWQAVEDYLPHRVPSGGPEGHGPLLTTRNGRRFDSNSNPGRIVKKLAARVPQLIFEPASITPDRVAHSPAVLLERMGSSDEAPAQDWAPREFPLQERLRSDLRYALEAVPACQPAPGGCSAECEQCQQRRGVWEEWTRRWESFEPAYLSWDKPPYDHRQRPELRLLAFHAGRCAICGAMPVPGREQHREDRDPDTGLVRGCLCPRCQRDATVGTESFWQQYRTQPPAAILGIELRSPRRTAPPGE